MKLIIGPSVKSYLENGNAAFLFAFLTMLIMPVYHWYLPPVMILWVLIFFYMSFFGKESFRSIDHFQKLLFLLFILFFLWQLTGMIYSDNQREGWRNIELRISLLMFPLVLLLPGEMIRKRIQFLIKVFAVSTLLFIVICYFYALFRSLGFKEGALVFNPHVPEYSWLNYFYSLEFAIFQHTSYLSMFTLLSAYISFENFFHNAKGNRIKYFWFSAALILLISIYFLSSRAVMLATFVSLPLYLFIKFRQKGKTKYFLGAVIAMILVFIPVVLTNPRINNYFNWRADHNISHIQVDNDRKVIWDSVIKIIGDNLIFGVGTGDIQDELNQRYMQSGKPDLAAVNTNAHNQYLEIVLENGLTGLVIFLLMFSVMFYIAVLNRNTLYLMFLTIVLISFLFETMLNRLAGVTFFSLFSFLLMLNNNEKDPYDGT